MDIKSINDQLLLMIDFYLNFIIDFIIILKFIIYYLL